MQTRTRPQLTELISADISPVTAALAYAALTRARTEIELWARAYAPLTIDHPNHPLGEPLMLIARALAALDDRSQQLAVAPYGVGLTIAPAMLDTLLEHLSDLSAVLWSDQEEAWQGALIERLHAWFNNIAGLRAGSRLRLRAAETLGITLPDEDDALFADTKRRVAQPTRVRRRAHAVSMVAHSHIQPRCRRKPKK